ncbi:hypothetical protein GAR05_03975 [Micromonospora saelicesensis]|uniref:Uncharacterized protein n=1 Tax=Micromonospora saelicesensis TaxID=285676 RepID=A0ABX9CGB6_9ACTN|nr:hypothetical protein GAR05_03975 [Micromonospora saelicesensis]
MKAHRTDLVSFAFGLVFLALSAWWLLAQLLGLALPPVGWFLAGALILIGVFGLVGALRSGRPNQPEPISEAGAAEAVAPVSGTSVSGAPVSGAATSTSGAALPVWEAERSTWDTPSSDPTLISDPTRSSDPTLISDPTPSSDPTLISDRTLETPTTEVRAQDVPATDVIHPAWLAHSPSEPPTEPIPGQPGNGDDQPTIGNLARPASPEGDEPTRPDQPVEATGDQPGAEREGPRREA